ncbi:hypothetical protein [Breoghania sp.]|uniref:LysE family translocator n=1 Tax=Breoghania sp. TaxID=2065378 RepID=UPI0026036B75|nr:hypothetical protein [Breoghania sp.]MDJ0931892.1 hypothetical protein [Breoghania sp.]
MSLQASNPKNLAIFVAIIPQFIDPAGQVVGQMVVLGIISVVVELPVLVAYTLAFSTLAWVITASAILWLEAAAGGVLVMLGGALAWQRRT